MILKNPQQIDNLLEKYWEGNTSLEEENLLREYFLLELPDERHKNYTPLFEYFAEQQKEKPENTTGFSTPRKPSPVARFLAVAAAVVLFSGTYALIDFYRQRQQAREAYENTRYAFRLIAENVNTGRREVGKLEIFDHTTGKVFKKK